MKSITVSPPRPEPIYLPTKYHLDPSNRFVTRDIGRKLEDVPVLVAGAGSLSNTVWPGPRPTFIPSGILIHPTVWLR